MIDITYVLGFLVLMVNALVIALLVYYWPNLKAEMNLEKMKYLQFFVDLGIYAYEKLIQGYKKGPERKEAVKQFLNKHGFDADMEVVSVMIDAGVEKMNQQLNKLKESLNEADNQESPQQGAE